MNHKVENLKGKLIVSCQALPEEPLHSSFIMGRMALAAKEGGASGIRANTKEDIKEIQSQIDLPIIGIVKRDYADSDIYITPTMKEIDELMEVKPEIIAMDATISKRPGNKTLDENGEVKSAYEWFNGFMGLVLGILIGTFILGAFTKGANTFGAVAAFIASSAVMVYIKYFVPADRVTIWSYSIISIVVSLVIGIPASIIYRKVKGDTSVPAANTTIYKN